MELFNASGTARRLRASPLFAIGPSEPGPSLRRGALVAIPVGLALLLELGLDSPSKGAIGTGALLAAVAAYWLLGMSEHGFWIPLTVLFVLRPEREETFHRLSLRAVGALAGLLVATALAEWLGGDGVAVGVALTIATGLAYGLLTVQ